MRLDKFLVSAGICSRSEAKTYIKKGRVSVNGVLIKDNDYKLDENSDSVAFDGNRIGYQEFSYYMLYKPSGVVSATSDERDKTVMDLLCGVNTKDFFPVGRLDKDTEGLLLITNDGELSHYLLSPKRHVDKTYLVHTKEDVTEEDLQKLCKGVDIGEKNLTLPAQAEALEPRKILLTICEGKFHQVKRMLQAVGNEVVYLKRVTFGPLMLDEALEKGAYRELTEEEITKLKGCIK